jgi:hypothetical protein
MGVPDPAARSASVPPNADRQAQDLINANQYEDCLIPLPFVGGIGCAANTDGVAVGTKIGGMALGDPAQARQVFEKVMDKTSDADERREVARGLGQSMPPDLLRRLAETPDGRAMLARALAELNGDLGRNGNEWAANQIGTAIKTADFKGSEEFKALDPATQQSLLGSLGVPLTSPAVIDNLIALAKSAGFQAATPATRKELLSALAQHPKDEIFREGLQKLARDPAFKRLTPAEQVSAINSFEAVARTESYRGKEGGWLFGADPKVVRELDKRQILENAIRVVTSPGFHDVGAPSKKAILDALDSNAIDPAFTGRLVKLINDPGFMALNDSTKETKLLNAYADDRSFAKGIDALTADARYTALGGADRARVLGDVVKLRETKSYKDANAVDRQAMVEIIGNISAQSAANPANTALRNTINQVVDDKIKLGLYERAPFTSGGKTFYNWGKADKDGIYLNTHKDVRTAAIAGNKYIDTLAHEVNHKLNGVTTAGTADRFLDEYRAAVVGRETALGRKLNAAEEKAIVDNLVDGTNADYAHLANLYNTDAKFKTAVDDIYKALKGSTDPTTGTVTAPVTVEPEDARQRLLTAGNSSDYLNKAGNLDNH